MGCCECSSLHGAEVFLLYRQAQQPTRNNPDHYEGLETGQTFDEFDNKRSVLAPKPAAGPSNFCFTKFGIRVCVQKVEETIRAISLCIWRCIENLSWMECIGVNGFAGELENVVEWSVELAHGPSTSTVIRHYEALPSEPVTADEVNSFTIRIDRHSAAPE